MLRVRLGAFAGIGGALLMTFGWIAGGLLQGSGYSWSQQEISDLGALTAQHPWVWNLADSLSGLLILIFAVSLFRFMQSNRAGRIGAGLIAVVGVGSFIDGIVREDCPLSTSEACQRLQDEAGLSWHHQAHDIESVIVVMAMIAAPFFLGRAVWSVDGLANLYRPSLGAGALLAVATVAYLFLYGNPGAGIAQRLLALAFVAWIAAISIALLKFASLTQRDRAEQFI
jgi:hypothetical membrane protein